MEHWLDGDKWDQVGKYTESDFDEDVNNIHYDKTMLLAAHMGKSVVYFSNPIKDVRAFGRLTSGPILKIEILDKVYQKLINERRDIDSQLHRHKEKAVGIGK